jgi:cation:H+ antiporter
MTLPIVLLLASAIAIYLACEFFVNGVEWLGRRLAVGETATGTVLAAFGTALPESVVTLVAVVFGSTADEKNIGVGAALGGPLVLGTIAYAVVGVSLWLNGRRGAGSRPAIAADARRLSRDQGWFLIIFVAKIALGLVAFPGKRWLGFPFLAAYALYVARELRGAPEAAETEALEPLKLQPRTAEPTLGWAALQTTLALVAIFVASRIFVRQLNALGPLLGLPPQLLALLLSPVATEMPEILNAVIWVRQGKARLALCNISGAMMIQATVPSALGIIFTPWLLDAPLLLGAGFTVLAVAGLFAIFRTGRVTSGSLIWPGALYLIFAFVLWVR